MAAREVAREVTRIVDADDGPDLLDREGRLFNEDAGTIEAQLAQVARRRAAEFGMEQMGEARDREVDAARELGDRQRPFEVPLHRHDRLCYTPVHTVRLYGNARAEC